jgi:hypothetical protein
MSSSVEAVKLHVTTPLIPERLFVRSEQLVLMLALAIQVVYLPIQVAFVQPVIYKI